MKLVILLKCDVQMKKIFLVSNTDQILLVVGLLVLLYV